MLGGQKLPWEELGLPHMWLSDVPDARLITDAQKIKKIKIKKVCGMNERVNEYLDERTGAGGITPVPSSGE